MEKLARYTGLSPMLIERANLRITIYRFVKELLRDQGRTVGRIDSRFTGADGIAAGELNTIRAWPSPWAHSAAPTPRAPRN
ncbi:MAG: hypothetical protein R2851_13570 [Caldilineaceae bacterium]